MPQNRVIAFLVLYQTRPFSKLFYENFHRHVRDVDLLLVDNNLNPKCPETCWARSIPHYLANRAADKSHGAGMDCAVEWARARGYQRLVHVEPDCAMNGRIWLDTLLRSDAWFAGLHRKRYGPIHPCPSVFDLSAPLPSFCAAQKIPAELRHPRYGELFNPSGLPQWCKERWDTAQKAWFWCAVENQAELVPIPAQQIGGHLLMGDFVHFWRGS